MFKEVLLEVWFKRKLARNNVRRQNSICLFSTCKDTKTLQWNGKLPLFCFSRQENEDAYYNDGRKGTCSLNLSKAKLIETQKIHILDESSHFYPSANRLKKDTSLPAHDIFSLHVLYHKLCSNKFKYTLLQ